MKGQPMKAFEAGKKLGKGAGGICSFAVAVRRAQTSYDWQQYVKGFSSALSEEERSAFHEYCREQGFFDGYTEEKIEKFWE